MRPSRISSAKITAVSSVVTITNTLLICRERPGVMREQVERNSIDGEDNVRGNRREQDLSPRRTDHRGPEKNTCRRNEVRKDAANLRIHVVRHAEGQLNGAQLKEQARSVERSDRSEQKHYALTGTHQKRLEDRKNADGENENANREVHIVEAKDLAEMRFGQHARILSMRRERKRRAEAPLCLVSLTI